jgi:hypothetical protein
MKLTCSKTTTLSFISASHSVSNRTAAPFGFQWSVLQRACSLPLILVQFSVRENLLIVTGNPESKQLKDMLPDIIKQVGPQQYEALKNLMGDFGKKAGAKTEDDDEDDVPPLV